MTDFTPGPWRTSEQWGGIGVIADDEVFAGVYDDSPWAANAKANAKLMAAAPDLLKALQDLAAKDHPPEYAPEVVRAGEAISKALGR